MHSSCNQVDEKSSEREESHGHDSVLKHVQMLWCRFKGPFLRRAIFESCRILKTTKLEYPLHSANQQSFVGCYAGCIFIKHFCRHWFETSVENNGRHVVHAKHLSPVVQVHPIDAYENATDFESLP